MGRIPSSFVDDLIARVDIIDIVDSAVPLRRAGKNHVACCPFHKEKTPSFTVSSDKQFYYCFGCGANGNAIGFMMDYHHRDFVEAVEMLAQRAGLEVPREASNVSSAQRQQYQALYDILEKANQFYQQQLRQSADKSRAVDYLKGRGLSGQIAKDFQVGFAPPGWNNLINNEQLADFSADMLVKSGMSIAKNEQGEKDRALQYDRFRDRIIFPIRDQRGRTIAFGGRVLGDDKPKYLNSPETPVFIKGQELYGFYEAKKANNKIQKVIVVEGYMDVIALAQMGINNAVATLGTAISSEHLHSLFKTVDEVIFCFDGDPAGKRAAERALNTCLPLLQDGRQIRFLFLADGEDPDTLVRKEGPEVFKDMIDNCTPLSEYLFEHLGQQLDLDTMDGRARLAKLASPMINKMPKSLFYEMMIARLSELTRLERSIIQKTLEEDFDREKEKQAKRDQANEAYKAQHNSVSSSKPEHNHQQEHSASQIDSAPPAQYDDMPTHYPDIESGQGSDPGTEMSYGDDYSGQDMPNAMDGFEAANFDAGNGPASPIINAVLKLVLQIPSLVLDCEIPDEVYKLQAQNMDLLVELFNYIKSNSNADGGQHSKVTTAMIIGHWHGTEEGFLLTSLAAEEPLLENQDLATQFKDAIHQLIKQYFDNELRKKHSSGEEIQRLLNEKAKYRL